MLPSSLKVEAASGSLLPDYSILLDIIYSLLIVFNKKIILDTKTLPYREVTNYLPTRREKPFSSWTYRLNNSTPLHPRWCRWWPAGHWKESVWYNKRYPSRWKARQQNSGGEEDWCSPEKWGTKAFKRTHRRITLGRIHGSMTRFIPHQRVT